MNDLERISATAKAAGGLVDLLAAEGITDFHAGLKSIVRMGTQENDSPGEAFEGMSRCLRTMSRGNGSFNDLVLDRDTFEERRDINNHRYELKAVLSDALSEVV